MKLVGTGRRSACPFLFAVLLAVFAGCDRPSVTESSGTTRNSGATESGSESKWPEKFVIAHNLPENPKERLVSDERFQKLEAYLERTLKLDVVSYQSGDYTATIEAMRAAKIDLCEIGAFSYVLAHKIAHAEPLVMRGTKSKGPLTYESVIITKSSSPFQTLDEALAKADQLAFAFEFPTSTSGHLVPRGYLDSIGVKPEEKFKSVVHNAAYPTGILAAIAGKVDLTCANTAALNHMQDMGMIKAEDIRILWTSPPMPREPIAIRGTLPDDFKKAVQQAYLKMDTEDPETFKLICGSKEPDAIFLPGDDTQYDYYRDIARGIEQMQALLE